MEVHSNSSSFVDTKDTKSQQIHLQTKGLPKDLIKVLYPVETNFGENLNSLSDDKLNAKVYHKSKYLNSGDQIYTQTETNRYNLPKFIANSFETNTHIKKSSLLKEHSRRHKDKFTKLVKSKANVDKFPQKQCFTVQPVYVIYRNMNSGQFFVSKTKLSEDVHNERNSYSDSLTSATLTPKMLHSKKKQKKLKHDKKKIYHKYSKHRNHHKRRLPYQVYTTSVQTQITASSSSPSTHICHEVTSVCWGFCDYVFKQPFNSCTCGTLCCRHVSSDEINSDVYRQKCELINASTSYAINEKLTAPVQQDKSSPPVSRDTIEKVDALPLPAQSNMLIASLERELLTASEPIEDLYRSNGTSVQHSFHFFGNSMTSQISNDDKKFSPEVSLSTRKEKEDPLVLPQDFSIEVVHLPQFSDSSPRCGEELVSHPCKTLDKSTSPVPSLGLQDSLYEHSPGFLYLAKPSQSKLPSYRNATTYTEGLISLEASKKGKYCSPRAKIHPFAEKTKTRKYAKCVKSKSKNHPLHQSSKHQNSVKLDCLNYNSNCLSENPKSKSCQMSHDRLVSMMQRKYNGEILCIHDPPCILINGCLNLPLVPKQDGSVDIWSMVSNKPSFNPKVPNRSKNRDPVMPSSSCHQASVLSMDLAAERHIIDRGIQYYSPNMFTTNHETSDSNYPSLDFKNFEDTYSKRQKRFGRSFGSRKSSYKFMKSFHKPSSLVKPELRSVQQLPIYENVPMCMLEALLQNRAIQRCPHSPRCAKLPVLNNNVLHSREEVGTQVRPKTNTKKPFIRTVCDVTCGTVPECVEEPICEVLQTCCRKIFRQIFSNCSHQPNSCRIM